MNQESHITQNKDIKFLKGVGPKRAELYKKLNINTTFDLLQHYPRKYIDCTNPMKIADIPPFEAGVIKATVYNKTSGNLIKKNMMIFKVLVSDNVSNLLITIFNNKYLYDSLEVGKDYIFYGIISGNFIKREMSNPTVIALKNASTMKPIYKLTKGLSSNIIQSNVKTAFSIHENDLIEYLPKGIIQKYNLVGIKEAIKQIHFPENENKMQQAKNRLVFDELLILILALAQRGKNKKTKKVCGFQISFETNILDEFFQILPFELTIDQLKAIEDCRIDMEKPTPMARLIQGDVGSGKTLVSAAVMFLMAKSNFQSALMAPTEILAKQHFKTLYPIFEKLKIKTALLCGSTPKKEKLEIKQSLANGEIDILIGTHALITDDVTFKALELVITDEQHRFGVKQRETIANKGKNPHVLVMSATPIPRSLGLVLYGDLDISLIKTMPKGRKEIQTFLVDTSKRERMYTFIKKQLDCGYQGYIVCPAVEENDETQAPQNIENVTDYEKKIKATYFSKYKTAILHGKMKPAQKDLIMSEFLSKKLNLLICTTVIEVGVDVPNANIIIIENAERFGLSQLHQLRGRVGRGNVESFCVLVSDEKSANSRQRLKTLANISDGFLLAEEDLKMRGPGDFFGDAQHGLPKFKIADLTENSNILSQATNCAKCLIKEEDFLSLEKYSSLKVKLEEFLNKINYGNIS